GQHRLGPRIPAHDVAAVRPPVEERAAFLRIECPGSLGKRQASIERPPDLDHSHVSDLATVDQPLRLHRRSKSPRDLADRQAYACGETGFDHLPAFGLVEGHWLLQEDVLARSSGHQGLREMSGVDRKSTRLNSSHGSISYA